MVLNRWNKVWIVITLLSLLIYIIYWLNSIYGWVYRRIIVSIPEFPSFFWADPVLPAIGDSFRFIGVILALLSIYLMWGPKQKPITSVKKYIAIALLFEGIFFLAALPANIILFFRFTGTVIQSFAYLLQNILILPLLIVLGAKVWRYQELDRLNLLKWVGITALVYLIGIWFVNVFKWVSMAQSEGIEFLLSGTTLLGFLNSAITLSMALIFAAAGFYAHLKQNRWLSAKLGALALIMLGLHFAFFILYVAITDAWRWVFLTEFWPITLLGLGLSMITIKTER